MPTCGVATTTPKGQRLNLECTAMNFGFVSRAPVASPQAQRFYASLCNTCKECKQEECGISKGTKQKEGGDLDIT